MFTREVGKSLNRDVLTGFSGCRPARKLGWLAVGVLVAGCSSTGLEQVDRRAAEMVAEQQRMLGGSPEVTDLQVRDADSLLREPVMAESAVTERDPATVNPVRDRLAFEPDRTGREIGEWLDYFTTLPDDAPRYDLQETLSIAVANSREYLTAKEELLLASLRLLSQRHLFGTRLFNESTANIDILGEGGDSDIALRLTNEFRVTRNLRSGGSLSARALVSATEQLREVISDSTSQSASVILAADIPLLRGAGMVAEENLLSAEREMVYATRTFERFRRQFLFSIATDYFDLVFSSRRIKNEELVLESRRGLLRQTEAIAEAGRRAKVEVGEALQRVLQSENNVAAARDSFVVGLEQFRSRIGLPPASPFMIKEELTLDVPVPLFDMEESVRRGLLYRLDLQNTRDQVDDTRRAVRNSRNALLPELNLNASMQTMTADDIKRAGLQFDFDDSDYRAGITFGLPLDREIERIGLRQSIIALERSQRRLRDAEDDVALAVRRTIRDIQLARFSYDLELRSVESIRKRIEGLNLRTDTNPRSLIDADDDLRGALEGRDRALRNLRVAILRFLLDTGQFRISTEGGILLPPDLEAMVENAPAAPVAEAPNP